MQPDVVVTYVHGTFATEAQWTSSQSPLSKSIAEGLENREVQFLQHRWTGHNSIAARQQAASELVVSLERAMNQFPAAKHFVIGHSHGGSVIAYALNSHRELAPRLAGVAFLSTPFLFAELRPFSALIVKAVSVAIGLGAYLAALMIAVRLLPTTDLAAWLLPVTLTLLITMMVVLSSTCHRRLTKAIDRVRTFSVRASLRELPPAHCLFLRTTADEAFSGLSMAQFINYLSGRATIIVAALVLALTRATWWIPRFLSTSLPARVGRMLEALPIKRGAVVEVLRFLLFVVVTLGSLVASLVIGAWLLVLFMLSSAIGMAMLARLDSLEALKGAFGEFSFAGLYASLHGVDGTIIRFLGLYIGVACVVISAGALLLWLALSLVASLFNLAFGKLFVVATLFLDISVEASPLGRYESHHVMPNIEGGPRFFSLRHSQSHSTPAAIAVIAEWIRRR